MDLHPKPGLADARARDDRQRRQPDVDAETGDVALPDLFLQVAFEQGRRNAEIPADGLADAVAVECPGQVVRDRVGDGTVEFVPQVVRRDEIIPLRDRFDDVFDPVGGDRSQIRIEQCDDVRFEEIGRFEDGADGRAFAREPAVDADQDVDVVVVGVDPRRRLAGVVG